MNSKCVKCGSIMVISDRGKILCTECNPKKRCELCNRTSSELELRHVMERSGKFSFKAWNICTRCKRQNKTRKPKKVQTNG